MHVPKFPIEGFTRGQQKAAFRCQSLASCLSLSLSLSTVVGRGSLFLRIVAVTAGQRLCLAGCCCHKTVLSTYLLHFPVAANQDDIHLRGVTSPAAGNN